MTTYSPKAGEVQRKWYVIDAEDIVLGRLATTAANLLRGKHKPQYAPHIDTGDFVVVVNASKIALTGKKATDSLRYDHSGRPGGLRVTSIGEDACEEPAPCRGARGVGHDAQEQAVASAAQEAEGVWRP
ncbi:hypothetical protein JCM18916A_01140 [Cutibacterium acnes subsp. acnes]